MMKCPQEPVRILSAGGQEIFGTITEHNRLAMMITVVTDDGEVLISLVGALIEPMRVCQSRRDREVSVREKIGVEAREKARRRREAAWEEGQKDYQEDILDLKARGFD